MKLILALIFIISSTFGQDAPQEIIDQCRSIANNPDSNVYLVNPTSCTSFYQCSNGVPYLQPCPSDLYYNPKLQVCDWKENVQCTSSTSSNIIDTIMNILNSLLSRP
uniref:Chitin-binding type-2 domain-containing protein n=2 Tax=Lutzomyia longipalpis TaxID=7200 RepID=A0A1B0CBD9_LUTLO